MPTSVMKKTRTRTQYTDCCKESECDSGLRNNYFDGKRLSTHSFRVEQEYGLERRRLLNRAIYGWGVVYGYGIEPEPLDECKKQREAGKLGIGPGLALDQCGRELLQTCSRNLAPEDLIAIDKDGNQADLADLFPPAEKSRHAIINQSPRDCWLISAHYAEQYNSPIDIKSACQCQHQEWDQICEVVRYSLRRINCQECRCNFKCELNCECETEPGANETHRIEAEKQTSHAELPPPSRGGCKCLCQYITNLKLEDDCGPLCQIEEPCGKVRVDLQHGVPLACVEVVWDRQCDQGIFGTQVETCGPRRLVKRNDLLFDLIRGCDLTRISEIGWAKWHRAGYTTSSGPISFEHFRGAFGDIGRREDEYVTRDFWVRFSRPVREETLLPDCFAITVMSGERGEGWWETLRVPIRRVDTSVIPSEPGDPAGYVRGARVVVDGAWADDALAGTVTRFQGAGAWVEIEVRGDFILDCNGQTVDANPVGLSPYPSGNGAPGDTFLSCFRVAPAEPHHYKGAKL